MYREWRNKAGDLVASIEATSTGRWRATVCVGQSLWSEIGETPLAAYRATLKSRRRESAPAKPEPELQTLKSENETLREVIAQLQKEVDEATREHEDLQVIRTALDAARVGLPDTRIPLRVDMLIAVHRRRLNLAEQRDQALHATLAARRQATDHKRMINRLYRAYHRQATELARQKALHKRALVRAQPAESAGIEAPMPNDKLTLAYLRAWFKTRSPEQKTKAPPIIQELIKPWFKRGTIWTGIVLDTKKAGIRGGLTPVEASGGTNAAFGEGGLQRKKPPKRKKAEKSS